MLDSLKKAAGLPDQQSGKEHSERRKIGPRHRDSLRSSFGDLLDELKVFDEKDTRKPAPDDFQELAPEKQQATKKLLESFNYNFCYSSVEDDTAGQKDFEKRELYMEALDSSLQNLYLALNIPTSNETEIELKLKHRSPFSFNELVWLSRPNTLIERLIAGQQAKDIAKTHLANIYPNIKTVLKEFFGKNRYWLETKTANELVAIQKHLEQVLTLCDSLEAIIKRQPLLYPNLSILEQDERKPSYLTKPSTNQKPLAPKAIPTNQTETEWSDLKNMFRAVRDSSTPVVTTGHTNDTEIEVWLLHTSLAEDQYIKLCQYLDIQPSSVIKKRLASLRTATIGTPQQQTNLEEITSLLEKQVTAAERILPQDHKPDLVNAKFSLRSIVEQVDTLKKVSLRNTDNIIKVSGETISIDRNESKSNSLFESVKNAFRKTRDWGNHMIDSIKNWITPKNEEKAQYSLIRPRKPKSLRSLWLAAAFTSFFSGSQTQEESTKPENVPVTQIANIPLMQPQTNETSKPAAIASNDITEQTSQDGILAESSIQRRLQNTLKGPQALQMFIQMYGAQLKPSEAQQTYIANTFAHILRPHLRIHSATTTAPLHISYLGTAPHHRHAFTVWSGNQSETVRVHIPSWANLSQGMINAGMPNVHPTPRTIPAPVLTDPSTLDSGIASNSSPPLPPGVTSIPASSQHVMAALDALHLSDQMPAAATKPVDQTASLPNAIELALDELAQADRTPRQPKRTEADLALEELAQADARNNQRT